MWAKRYMLLPSGKVLPWTIDTKLQIKDLPKTDFTISSSSRSHTKGTHRRTSGTLSVIWCIDPQSPGCSGQLLRVCLSGAREAIGHRLPPYLALVFRAGSCQGRMWPPLM